MSLDFQHDYSNHELLSNKNRYTELFKLDPVTAADIHKGDLVLLKTSCGKYGIFVVMSESDTDETVHLSKYSDYEFTKDSSV